MARSVASQARREVHYTDPDTGQKYRDATNYVYACALECALHGAPNTNRWWDHEYSEEKAGDMIEIILAFAWMDKCKSPNHFEWREAVEDLVRTTEILVTLITGKMHHRFWAQRVQQALVRINNAKRVRLHATKRKASDLQQDEASERDREEFAKYIAAGEQLLAWDHGQEATA